MLNTLASHNPDIKQLLEKGYALGWDSNYLVVRDIPYLDDQGQLQNGAFVMKLNFIDDVQVQMVDHTLFFCGSHPHELTGEKIAHLGGGPTTLSLTATDIVVQRNFSHKPPDGYKDLFEKIETYVTVIAGPAISRCNANPLTFRTVETNQDSVFKYVDTLTSRAEITDLAQLFKTEVVAIIGLGGTGSYVLDFLVKTPVKEIRGFDFDEYQVHNAFRSPGKLLKDELGKKKAAVYQQRYEGFRHGLRLLPKIIQADSTEDLQDVTFAFVCVDKGPARAGIVAALTKMDIPFIDVGMGLGRDKGPISGILRSTYVSSERSAETLSRGWLPMSDPEGDVYRVQIQIAELNALNACLAVIKYKQLKGFYADDSPYANVFLTLDNLQLLPEW